MIGYYDGSLAYGYLNSLLKDGKVYADRIISVSGEELLTCHVCHKNKVEAHEGTQEVNITLPKLSTVRLTDQATFQVK